MRNACEGISVLLRRVFQWLKTYCGHAFVGKLIATQKKQLHEKHQIAELLTIKIKE